MRRDQIEATARSLWPEDYPLDMQANVRWVVQFHDGESWSNIPGSETESLQQAQLHRSRLAGQLTNGSRAEGWKYRVRTISDQPALPL